MFHILCHLNLWAREDMSLGTVQDPLGLLLFSSHPRNAIITGQQRPNNSKDCCQSNRPARIVAGVQLRFAAEPCQGTLATALPCWCELPSHLWPPLRSPTKPVLVCGFTTCTPSRAGRLNYYRKCQRQALRTTHTRKPRLPVPGAMQPKRVQLLNLPCPSVQEATPPCVLRCPLMLLLLLWQQVVHSRFRRHHPVLPSATTDAPDSTQPSAS